MLLPSTSRPVLDWHRWSGLIDLPFAEKNASQAIGFAGRCAVNITISAEKWRWLSRCTSVVGTSATIIDNKLWQNLSKTMPRQWNKRQRLLVWPTSRPRESCVFTAKTTLSWRFQDATEDKDHQASTLFEINFSTLSFWKSGSVFPQKWGPGLSKKSGTLK